jgi:VWFA-related protein
MMHRSNRFLPLLLVALPLLAQQERDFVIPVEVFEVVAPVIVKNNDGRYVNGLEAKDFKLYDNNKLQEIKLEFSIMPISMVVAIQSNHHVEAILPQIKTIGPLLEGLIVGSTGEAAILAFDHRMQVLQDFTNDGRLFKDALEKLRPGSTTSAMVDSIFTASRMLAARPKTNRRIILLISETRDRGSEGRLREALLAAQFQNIIIYTVNINRLLTSLTAKGQPPRWDNLPPGSRPRIPGAPMSPNTTAQVAGIQGNSADFTPLIIEMFRQVKAVFFDNPVEVFTSYTGGREYSFINTSTLARVMTDLGEELHSQYLLAYRPNNKDEGGWHDIKVTAGRHKDIRTRPGYWIASRPAGQ